jgi:hypothetical protein
LPIADCRIRDVVGSSHASVVAKAVPDEKSAKGQAGNRVWGGDGESKKKTKAFVTRKLPGLVYTQDE